MKPDHERVSKLLLDTVTLLCKNGLTYETELKVQGLLAITLDSAEIFVVHLNESFGPGGANCVPLHQNDREPAPADGERQPARKRHAPAANDEVVDLTRLVETPDIRPARLAASASSSNISDGARRRAAAASIQAQQRSQMQCRMPSPMSSLAEVANRMLPPQGMPPTAVPGYPVPQSAQAMRNSALAAAGSESFARTNAPILRQRFSNSSQLNSTLRDEDATANQRRRAALENRRLATAHMAASGLHQQQQQQQSGQLGVLPAGYSYGVSGSMQGPHMPNNYGAMPTRQRNATNMPPPHQTPHQGAVTGGGPQLSYRYPYPGNNPYEGQPRLMQSNLHMPGPVPPMPMLTERPTFPDVPNPVQQLMLDYERLGQQQNQSNIRGPMSLSTSLHMQTMGSNSYPTSDRQPNRLMHGSMSPHDAARLLGQSNSCDNQVIVKECSTVSGVSAPVRKSPRVRVEHIDLSKDIDDDVLHETLLSGLGSDPANIPTSSIVIQPDNTDSTLDTSILHFDLPSSPVHVAGSETGGAQEDLDIASGNQEFFPMGSVQEIMPVEGLSGIDGFDMPNDTNDGQLQSPGDGRMPTGLSDSGRSTGSERMDCMEESLPPRLDSYVEERMSTPVGQDSS